MSGIFSEQNMRQVLEPYIPAGEALAAGVHGIGLQARVEQVFGQCRFDGEQLVVDERASALQVTKRKEAQFDVYVGVTQRYLLLVPCEREMWSYEFNDLPDTGVPAAGAPGECIQLGDIGTCFPLADIRSCEVKKAWMGAVNCLITMKNGTFLKIMLPKRGGLGGGMPHHAEYREAIIAALER